MRVLVTGGTGFLGTHVLEQMPVNYTCYTLSRKLPMRLPFGNYVIGNLLNKKETAEAAKKVNPHVIVHLAAKVGGIGANKEYPGDFMQENLEMGMNIISAARQIPTLQKFIMVGTVCSYPKHCPTPFREEMIWNGYPEETNAPYGIAKKTLMELGRALHKQYGFPAVNLVPVNLYGPGDNFDTKSSHVIPALIRKIFHSDGKPVEIWGDGSASREFLYVEDAAKAIVKAIETPYIGPDFINIGSGHDITITRLANTIAALMGYEGKFIWDNTKPNGQPRRRLNVDKAYKLLNWKAETNLITGLQKTIEYYDTCRNLQ